MLPFFLNRGLIHFNSCSYCGSFSLIAELVTPIEISIKETKADKETHPVIAEPKIKKKLNIIRSCANLFVLFTHQFISVYFFS